MIHEAAILATAYFPNIQYFSKLLLHAKVKIDDFETYQKQSYRNRCTILGSNGPLNLSIPVIKPNGNRTLTNEIEIEYAEDWQTKHWRAIISAYRHSPFFEIFEDEFAPLFEKKVKFLIDWNSLVLDQIFQSTGYCKTLEYTTAYFQKESYLYDFRDSISPKDRLHIPDPDFKPHPYFQVFGLKHGFTPNLSFIDLLFNEGPQAIYLCQQATKKGKQI